LLLYRTFPNWNEKEMQLKSTTNEPLSVNMRTAVGLLWVFVIAIILAFLVTFTTGTIEMRLLSVAFITPITVLSIVFIYFCRKRKVWSYAGASILGAIGVILRVVVSTQPSLEVGGGLPIGVTALYIVLGALVSLKCYESVLELRK
jgi:FtsH-binding integral membrane protein